MDYPWARIIGPEADSHEISLCFSNIHNVSADWILEIEGPGVSTPDNTEGMLGSEVNLIIHVSEKTKGLLRGGGMGEGHQSDRWGS